MTEASPDREYLTFHFLDDVWLLPLSERQKKISQAAIHRIGPLVEYALFDRDAACHSLDQLRANEARNLSKTLQTKDSLQPISSRIRAVEFFRIPLNGAAFSDNAWVAFCMRLQSAAKNAGLLDKFSGQLAGTFEEMVGNVVEHSDHPETGIVGYRWKQGEFEYVVADNGIGLIRSLKKHPDYASISDAGQALETALTDGESSKGKQALCGKGFNTLILNIASRNSFLRFRSGDHCHVIDGTKPSPRFTSQLCSDFQGFHISVVCRP